MALSPYVQAWADDLVADAPPLTPERERAVQRILGPVVRDLAQPSAA